MRPYQQRVVDEKKELDDKLEKLSKFIDNEDLFFALEIEDQDLLGEQEDLMKRYSEVLQKRIERF